MTIRIGNASPNNIPSNDAVIQKAEKSLTSEVDGNSVGTNSSTISQEESKPVNERSSIAKRSEVDMAGQARYAALAKDLPKAPPTTIETPRHSVGDPEKIANNPAYTDNQKAAFFHDYISKASPEAFKKLIADSQNWPPASRRNLDQALAKTAVPAERAARDLEPAQQKQFLDRMLALGHAGDYATNVFVKSASPKTLSEITSNLGRFENLGKRVDGQKQPSGKVFLDSIAERSRDLTPDARLAFTKTLLDFNVFDKGDLRGNESYRKHTFERMFKHMSPEDKNRLFDDMQNKDMALDFARNIGGEWSVPQHVLSGLTDKNADFLRQMYAKLANDAKGSGDEKMRSLYERNSKHVQGWIENHFPNYVMK